MSRSWAPEEEGGASLEGTAAAVWLERSLASLDADLRARYGSGLVARRAPPLADAGVEDLERGEVG